MIHDLITDLDSYLFNYYPDDEPIVAICVSLGASRELRFRKRKQTAGYEFSIPIINGSLYVIAGQVQRYYEHSSPKNG